MLHYRWPITGMLGTVLFFSTLQAFRRHKPSATCRKQQENQINPFLIMHSDFKAIKDVLWASNGQQRRQRNEEAELLFFCELSRVFSARLAWKLYKTCTLQWAVSSHCTDVGNNNAFFIKHLIIVQTHISHNKGGHKFQQKIFLWDAKSTIA